MVTPSERVHSYSAVAVAAVSVAGLVCLALASRHTLRRRPGPAAAREGAADAPPPPPPPIVICIPPSPPPPPPPYGRAFGGEAERAREGAPIMAATCGGGAGACNLLALQPRLSAREFADPDQLLRVLDASLRAARARGLVGPRTVLVLPEYIGTFLVASCVRGIAAARSLPRAMAAVAREHPLRFAGWALLAACGGVRGGCGEPLTFAAFRCRAGAMAGEYNRVFGSLAAAHGVTLVAGSILLPEPYVDEGGRVRASRAWTAPLKNVCAVYVARAFAAAAAALCAVPCAHHRARGSRASLTGAHVCARRRPQVRARRPRSRAARGQGVSDDRRAGVHGAGTGGAGRVAGLRHPRGTARRAYLRGLVVRARAAATAGGGGGGEGSVRGCVRRCVCLLGGGGVSARI